MASQSQWKAAAPLESPACTFTAPLAEEVAELLGAVRGRLIALAGPSRASLSVDDRRALGRLAVALAPVVSRNSSLRQAAGALMEAVGAAGEDWADDRQVLSAERRLAQTLLGLEPQPGGHVPWQAFDSPPDDAPPTFLWAEEG